MRKTGVRFGGMAWLGILAVCILGIGRVPVQAAGGVISWGYNSFGQLGSGASVNSNVPVGVVSSGVLAGKRIIQMAAGNSHSVALTSDGGIYAWGENDDGELGNGTNTGSNVPVAVDRSGVLAGKTIIQVAAGGDHNLALASDGTVYAWGDNYLGESGDGGNSNSKVPVAVVRSGALAGKSIIQVAASGDHSLALASDGTVYAWGYNSDGELGNGANSDTNTPVAVDRSGALAGKTIILVAAGADYSLALSSDGIVFAWGNNYYGTLGSDRTVESNVPLAVDRSGVLAGKSIIQVAAGYDHCLALASDGTVYAWGENFYGALGNGGNSDSNVPVAVVMNGVLAGKTIVQVAAGGGVPINAGGHSLALASDGTLYAWGDNLYGQLGNGANSDTNVPVAVDRSGALAGKSIIQASGGQYHSLALASDGTVYAWGHNYDWPIERYSGQLGDGISDTDVPAAVDRSGVLNGKSIIQVAGGYQHSLALASDGTVYAWGDNYDSTTGMYSGQLGNGASSNSSVPVAVNRSGVLAGKTIIQVAAGENHSLALASDGTIYAWGDNGYGDLGNGGYSSSSVPVAVNRSGVLAGKTIIQVAAGIFHSLAVASDGTVYGWGYNTYGQLGNGVNSDSHVPAAVDRSGVLVGKTIIQVAGGFLHSLALASDGTVYAWGSGGLGESVSSSLVPVAVDRSGALAGKTIIQIAAGYEHSLALASDGTVYAWGSNRAGELGNGGNTDSNVPVAVDRSGVMAGKSIIQIAAGFEQSLALASDGTVYAWGSNYYGELGNGTLGETNALYETSSIPVAVSAGGSQGSRVLSIAAGEHHNLAIVGPAWKAVDLTAGVDGRARLLWNSANNSMALWSVDDVGNFASSNGYGPYSGWAPRAVAVGTDGLTRVLWNNADGMAALWLMDGAGNFVSGQDFGPFPGWTAIDVAVGSDNKARLLWTTGDGRMAVWSVDNSGFPSYGAIYGFYSGWTPGAVAAGADGLTRVIWNRLDGAAALWLMGADGSFMSAVVFGPYVPPNAGPWMTADISVGADRKTRLLWTNPDGRMAVWSVDNQGTAAYGPIYGPYAGYTANRIAGGSDTLTRVLWSEPDGRAALWLMGETDPYNNVYETSFGYGPYYQ